MLTILAILFFMTGTLIILFNKKYPRFGQAITWLLFTFGYVCLIMLLYTNIVYLILLMICLFLNWIGFLRIIYSEEDYD